MNYVALLTVILVSSGRYAICFDPELKMNAVEIIQRWGYKAERHTVTTRDGYILELHRIPYGKTGPGSGKRPVIFMQHGLECSSTNWIINLPSESAGFIFADAGFDVWLGNFRGNTYSKHNVNVSNKDKKFWEFSWDEMAAIDLPYMIDYTLNYTGAEKLYYMGHSEGTMTAFAAFSSNPTIAKKIIKYFALAPVAAVKNIGGALKVIAPWTKTIEIFPGLVGINEFFPNNWLMDILAKYVCGFEITDKLLCGNIIFLIAGCNSKQLNMTRVPVYVSHTPAGTSTQNVVHFGQQVNSGCYCKYDYGKAKNQQVYGQKTPPTYDISKMEVPTALFWGDEDVLADPIDVNNVIIPNVKNMIANCELKGFNHLDFIWGLRAPLEIYWKIVNHIKHEEDLCFVN